MKLMITVLAAGLFSSSASTAQSIDCVALANTIAVGYTVDFSEKQFEALRYYAACEASDSSSGGGISIGYAAFNLGANYSEAESSQFCSQSREQLGISNSDYSYAKTVFSEALPTIDRCIAVIDKGWSVKYERVGADTISLRLAHGSTLGGKLLSAEVIPPNSLTCDPALPSDSVDVTPQVPLFTTCFRQSVTQVIGGVQVKSAEDAYVSLILEDGPFIIPLKGYEDSLILDLQKRIDEAKAEIMSLLPGPNSFYLKAIPPLRQHIDASCDAGDVLISAACTNDGGSQAAVGPRIYEENGVLKASCESYNPAGRIVEGTLICMKVFK